jgi:hypothetical protein
VEDEAEAGEKVRRWPVNLGGRAISEMLRDVMLRFGLGGFKSVPRLMTEEKLLSYQEGKVVLYLTVPAA